MLCSCHPDLALTSFNLLPLASTGLYASLILRFHLLFPQDYPSSPPTIFISTPSHSAAPFFHPLVSPVDGSVQLLPPTLEEERFSKPEDRNSASAVLFRLKDLFKAKGLERVREEDVKDKEAYRSALALPLFPFHRL